MNFYADAFITKKLILTYAKQLYLVNAGKPFTICTKARSTLL